MENKTVESVPYLVHESILARLTAEHEKERSEREKDRQDKQDTIKKLWITIIILIFVCVASNVAWFWHNSQFETVESTEVTQDIDSGDGNAIVTGIGDISYGESPTNG